METIPMTPLLEFPPNTLYKVRQAYGLEKPGEMAVAVKILDEWVQKQNHFLKKDFRDVYLERMIIMCKGSIEKSKKQLDTLCTLKTLLPKFFARTNMKEEFKQLMEKSWVFILPKMTEDLCRVFIFQLRTTTGFDAEVITQCYCILVAEYLKIHDYSLGYFLVYDYRHISATEIISKIDLNEVQQFVPILTDGYGTRLKALVFLTDSKVIHGFVKIMKTILSEKIGKRIQVFSDLESFYSIIPKELLPLEYGGQEKSVQLLHNNLLNVLSGEEHVQYLKEMQKAKTDESKRTVDKFNEQYMGMAGTFRSLHVD
ncbi:hypothetical protein K1T71_011327 [Dendrolimus kikuchii]|uniref:Uncharacterized protein n=1 Tax=Dendrolimus kikuchii TaxID=765133 RepID=A0ACC1CNW5_9NEOP|nr:hypothetical protein K1T71_011327 [Dendrolimus kikuchii]